MNSMRELSSSYIGRIGAKAPLDVADGAAR